MDPTAALLSLSLNPSLTTQQDITHRRHQQKVFALPELRQHLAKFLQPNHLRVCCLVSRQWLHYWLSLLWRSIVIPFPKNTYHYRNQRNQRLPLTLPCRGHLVRDLDLDSDDCRTELATIRDHCLNLTSLKVSSSSVDLITFEDQVLGLGLPPPMATPGPRPPPEKLMTKPLPNSKPNGFLSNSLRLLELHFDPEGCRTILPRLIEAKKTGNYLQNLQSFGMNQIAIYCMGFDDTPYGDEMEQPILLSDIFTFLDAFPQLKSFTASNCPIKDDLSSTSSPSMISLDQEAGMIRRYESMIQLTIRPSIVSTFEKLILTMPNLQELHLLEMTNDFLFKLMPLILSHSPDLTTISITLESEYNLGSLDDAAIQPTLQKRFSAWVPFLQSFPNLRRLVIANGLLPAIILRTLADSCPKLEALVTFGVEISVKGIHYMLERCKNLKTLTLEHIVLPSDFFVWGDRLPGPGPGSSSSSSSLSPISLPSSLSSSSSSPSTSGRWWIAPIEQLTLGQIRVKTPLEIEAFRKRLCDDLTKLRHLRISQGYSLSFADFYGRDHEYGNDDVVVGLSALPSMEGLATTASVENRALEWIYPALEELSIGSFKDKPPISAEEIKRMARSMPRLERLVVNEDIVADAITLREARLL